MGGANEVRTTANSHYLPAKVMKQNDSTVVLVDVAPGTKVVHITRAAP